MARADVLIKPALQDTVKFATIRVNNILVRDVRLQIDNVQNKIIAAAMFGSDSKFDIDGVFTITIDIPSSSILSGKSIYFSDSLRQECKLTTIPKRSTFNDFAIDEIIPYRSGGYALLIERRVAEGVAIQVQACDFIPITCCHHRSYSMVCQDMRLCFQLTAVQMILCGSPLMQSHL